MDEQVAVAAGWYWIINGPSIALDGHGGVAVVIPSIWASMTGQLARRRGPDAWDVAPLAGGSLHGVIAGGIPGPLWMLTVPDENDMIVTESGASPLPAGSGLPLSGGAVRSAAGTISLLTTQTSPGAPALYYRVVDGLSVLDERPITLPAGDPRVGVVAFTSSGAPHVFVVQEDGRYALVDWQPDGSVTTLLPAGEFWGDDYIRAAFVVRAGRDVPYVLYGGGPIVWLATPSTSGGTWSNTMLAQSSLGSCVPPATMPPCRFDQTGLMPVGIAASGEDVRFLYLRTRTTGVDDGFERPHTVETIESSLVVAREGDIDGGDVVATWALGASFGDLVVDDCGNIHAVIGVNDLTGVQSIRYVEIGAAGS